MARSGAAKKSKSKAKNSRKRAKLPSRKKAKKKTKSKAKKKKLTKKKTKATKKKTSKKAPAKKAKKISTKKAPTKKTKPKLEIPRPLAVVENKVNVGDMAPNFQLPDENAQIHNLEQYRGQNVILYFYPKDDTPGCTKEACNFRDQLPSFEGLNAVILGVSFDDQESHQKFIQKYNLNFHLLSDLDKKVAEEYGVYVEKNMYGKTYMGIERSTFVIDREGRIAAAIRGVKVDGHNDELIAELQKLS